MTVFGDSWSDDGTNEFPVTNYSVPDPKYYPGGRVSSGLVWTEYIMSLAKGAIASVENHAYVGAYACPMVGISQILSVDNMPYLNDTAAQLTDRRAGAIACLMGGVQTLAAAGETKIVLSGAIMSFNAPLLQLFNKVQLAAARALTVLVNKEIEEALSALQVTLPNTKLFLPRRPRHRRHPV